MALQVVTHNGEIPFPRGGGKRLGYLSLKEGWYLPIGAREPIRLSRRPVQTGKRAESVRQSSQPERRGERGFEAGRRERRILDYYGLPSAASGNVCCACGESSFRLEMMEVDDGGRSTVFRLVLVCSSCETLMRP